MRAVIAIQDPAREAQAAAREAQRAAQEAVREAQQAAQEAARDAAREAQREAQRAARDAIREATQARRGEPTIFVQPGVPPWQQRPVIPEEAVIISIAFFVMCAVIAIGIPLARAFARRMDRRGAADPQLGSDVRARLERIEHAVDAIAIEVERVSESQRYNAKVLSEVRALPQPNVIEESALAAIGREKERQR